MQTKLNCFDYKFGFNFSRKHYPNCLAKAPLNDDDYLVLDFYKPRKKGMTPGWYIAIRAYGAPRPKHYVCHIQESRNPITYNQAIDAFSKAYDILGVSSQGLPLLSN